jgi:hypothetical protein
VPIGNPEPSQADRQAPMDGHRKSQNDLLNAGRSLTIRLMSARRMVALTKIKLITYPSEVLGILFNSATRDPDEFCGHSADIVIE